MQSPWAWAQKEALDLVFRELVASENLVLDQEGGGGRSGHPAAKIHLRLPNLYWTIRILLKPDLMVGQTYVDDRWYVPPAELYDFLHLIRSKDGSSLQRWFLLSNSLHPIRDLFKQRFFPIRSTRAVAEHYDTDPEFVSLVLGRSLSYTCAFFREDTTSLDVAQRNKLNLIAHRISLAEGMTVLDIGSGWGYATFPLAEDYGCTVTGITISKAQVQFCVARQMTSAAANRLSFINVDYAHFNPPQRFDRAIAVGMLEHVGKYQYTRFFDKVSDLITDQGAALIHCIVSEEESSPDAWIDRHIFPGGYIPTISEVVRGIENSRCQLVQIFTESQSSYFKTLQSWKENLINNWDRATYIFRRKGLKNREIEAILKIWAYFLAASQISFSPEFGKCRTAQFLVRNLAYSQTI